MTFSQAQSRGRLLRFLVDNLGQEVTSGSAAGAGSFIAINANNELILSTAAAQSGDVFTPIDASNAYSTSSINIGSDATPGHELVVTGALHISKNSGASAAQLVLHEDENAGGRLSFTNTADTSGPYGNSWDWTIYGDPAAQGSQSDATLRFWYADADGDGSGQDILTIRGDQKIGIMDTTPSYTLDVNGDIRVVDDLFVDDFARIDALRVGTTATDPGDGNLYVEGNTTLGNADSDVTTLTSQLTASEGAYFADRVGIGDATPSYTLDVNGDIRVVDDLFVDDFARIDALRVGTTSTDPGDGNLFVEGSTQLGDAASDVTTVTSQLTASEGAYFADRVGIGDSTPTYTLDVNGDINIADNQYLRIGTTAVAHYTSNQVTIGSSATSKTLALATDVGDVLSIDATGVVTFDVAPDSTSGENTVLVINSSNEIKRDEIDSRVWGSTLVDATNGTSNEIPTFTDSNSITGESSLTYDGSLLTIGDGNYSDGETILKFNTDRHWTFLQVGNGSGAALKLQNTNGPNKNFIIQTNGETRFYNSSGAEKFVIENSTGDTDSAGTKNFNIEHPFKSGYRLRHTSIEGPLCDLIYRGKITLDGNEGVVDVDSQFGMTIGTYAALTKNPQVFLHNSTGWSPVRVKSFSEGILTIESQSADNDEVCWMVVATRRDSGAMASNSTDENGDLIVEFEDIEEDPIDEDPIDV
jgi:hypothetical protein